MNKQACQNCRNNFTQAMYEMAKAWIVDDVVVNPGSTYKYLKKKFVWEERKLQHLLLIISSLHLINPSRQNSSSRGIESEVTIPTNKIPPNCPYKLEHII